VKLLNANDSVGLPHVKVGRCQGLNVKAPLRLFSSGLFFDFAKGICDQILDEELITVFLFIWETLWLVRYFDL
jgi:hypothetical protein